MPIGSFQLELDTAPPEVEFLVGPGPKRGYLYTLGYTVDEPGIVSADFIDAQGQEWSLFVNDSTFTQTLSSTVALGMGEVVVVARDDVGNERTYRLNVAVLATGIVAYDDDLAVSMIASDDGSAFESQSNQPGIIIRMADGSAVLARVLDTNSALFDLVNVLTNEMDLQTRASVNIALTDEEVPS